ncbi:MAG: hypothetical protein HUU10_05175 [Bacteroidetes bacterium]|nr:hypothetical protein [Bacteroidota bacterium]
MRLIVSLLIVLSTIPSFAQLPADPTGSVMTGGLGMTYVDGKPYFLFNTAPELSFGPWGLGLDLNLRISPDGNIREEDWDEGYDFIRIIRYVRYAQKRAPLYVRVGQLTSARLGRGLLMYNYSNGISYDDRKIGLEFDMRFDKWGFETVSSNVIGADIWGGRAYFMPLAETGIPFLSSLETGATFIMDMNEDGRKLNDGGIITDNQFTEANPVTALAFDAGLPLLDNDFIDFGIYTEFGQFAGYGSGGSMGLETNLKGLGSFLAISAKLEHRINGDQFIANYFGPFYEVERLTRLSDTLYTTKLQALKDTKNPGNGLYGGLTTTILGTLQILGSYEETYRIKNSGLLHLGTDLGDMIPSVLARADYYKRGLSAGSSVFSLDDRSLLTAELGYKPYPFMVVSMFYQWTFVPEGDGDYKAVSKVEPKVSFVFRF